MRKVRVSDNVYIFHLPAPTQPTALLDIATRRMKRESEKIISIPFDFEKKFKSRSFVILFLRYHWALISVAELHLNEGEAKVLSKFQFALCLSSALLFLLCCVKSILTGSSWRRLTVFPLEIVFHVGWLWGWSEEDPRELTLLFTSNKCLNWIFYGCLRYQKFNGPLCRTAREGDDKIRIASQQRQICHPCYRNLFVMLLH